MFKIYKKVVVIDSANPDRRLEGPRTGGAGSWLANLIAVPAMILGGLAGVMFFSAFFALLLIPLAIWGIRAWWLVRKLKDSPVSEQCIDAEYTVVSENTDNPSATRKP